MQFEWDANKAKANIQEHGILFDDAAFVFADEQRIEWFDNRQDYGEDRFNTVGMVFGVLLCVCYTMRNRGKTIRIISARKAYGNEKRNYFANKH